MKYLFSMGYWRNYSGNLSMFLTVFGGFIIAVTIGGAYSYDTIFDQNYSNSSKISNNTKISNNMLDIYSVGMFGLSTSMGLGGYLSTKIGYRLTILLGSIIMNLGIYFTRITIGNTWYLCTYGFICGSGAGLIYSVILAAACQRFKFYKTFILSIVLSGINFGGILVQLTIGVKSSSWNIFCLTGTEFFIIQIIGLLLIQKPREDNIEIEHLLRQINGNNEQVEDIPPHVMISEFDFWIIWLIYNLNAFGSIFINLKFRNQLAKLIINKNHSPMYFHIASLSIVIAQIIWGLLSDCLSMKVVFSVFTLGSSFAYGTYLSIVAQPAHIITNRLLLFFILYSCRFWLSGIQIIIPGLIIKRFGQQHFASNYGITWTAYTFAGIITSRYIENIYDLEVCLSLFAVMSFSTFLLTLFYSGISKRYDRIFRIFSCFYT